MLFKILFKVLWNSGGEGRKDPEASKIFVDILEHVGLAKRKNPLLINYVLYVLKPHNIPKE